MSNGEKEQQTEEQIKEQIQQLKRNNPLEEEYFDKINKIKSDILSSRRQFLCQAEGYKASLRTINRTLSRGERKDTGSYSVQSFLGSEFLYIEFREDILGIRTQDVSLANRLIRSNGSLVAEVGYGIERKAELHLYGGQIYVLPLEKSEQSGIGFLLEDAKKNPDVEDSEENS